MNGTPADRLQTARRNAGYARPADASKAFGWNTNTYKSHENGLRGIRQPSAERYARAFHVSAGWILTGEGDAKRRASPRETTLLETFRGLPEAEQDIIILFCESLAQRLAKPDTGNPIRHAGWEGAESAPVTTGQAKSPGPGY